MPILCGTDMSPSSAAALTAAIALAERRGDRELVLVHIADAGLAGTAIDDTRNALLETTEMPARVAIRIEVQAGAAAGASAEALVALALKEKADLIILGAGPREKGRMGSFAGRLIEIATVPVILVREAAPWVEFGRGERAIKILAGVDDSATSELGLHWLKSLRQLGPVDVTLGSVYYPDEACEKYGMHLRSHVEPDLEVEALVNRDLLRRFDPAVGSGAVVAQTKLGIGRIGDHLIDLATDARVDAMVIGTRQRTGLGKLGSVSSVVVANALQSVICIPPEASVAIQTTPLIRSALVATDLSSFANRAIPYAFSIAQTGDVHILHVMSPEDDTSVDELRERLLQLRPHGVATSLHIHIERGEDTARCIAETSNRLGVDVICIASHNRTGLGRALLGSVADRLLRDTRVPIMILRPSP
jgi:nucleotide-binding universal stress UspA family protein